jgi:Spy/CpxP family protein refolding chaperone
MPGPATSPLQTFARNFVVGALAVIAAGLAFFAWLEHEELVALRSLVADYQQHPSGKKNRRNYADDLGKKPESNANEEADSGADGGKTKINLGDAENDRPKTKQRSGWRAYANMVGNPEFEKLSAAQARAQAGRTYALLFKSLNLAPDVQSRLQDLLAARQQAVTDAVVAARENGLKSKTAPTEFSQGVSQATAPIEAQIQDLIGASAFSQFQQYQASIPEQNLVGVLQQRLAATNTPLPDDQATQLLNFLVKVKAIDDSSTGPGTHSLLAGGGVAKITDATIAAAQQVLSAPQVQALEQIQTERLQQSEMDKLMKGKPIAPAKK